MFNSARVQSKGTKPACAEISVGWFFTFFFISGFCSILYELVWLRLAMSQFGVNTALVSIVLSMFMAGLGLGSWASGELLRKHACDTGFPALRVYALTELLIGVSAVLVPHELVWGRGMLERIGLSSSRGYYLASGTWIALTLVPWCALMGATIPIAMQAIRHILPQKQGRSFSFLYLANVGGAVFGTIVPLFLIELVGFHGTLKVGSLLNSSLAICALALTVTRFSRTRQTLSKERPSAATTSRRPDGNYTLLLLLFTAGLTSMGMEVVWIRQFTPYEGTVVYAFALILVVYLAATFTGSRIYRHWGAQQQRETKLLWILLGTFAIFSPVTANPHTHLPSLLRVILGIAPFSAVLGFLTPKLVDRWSGGEPARAGAAYAVNVLGCILGPLLSGFVLLPNMGERWVTFILALPWLLLGAYTGWSRFAEVVPSLATRAASSVLLPLTFGLILISKDYGQQKGFPESRVLRDHTATTIATGTGIWKQLLVNGVGMTGLTPITKMMAHVPLAMLGHSPQNALVICFGMGTTYRSLMSWGIPVTAVELVPSVPKLFSFYHADAAELLRSPLSHLVIDDGRRYLERTPQQYDVIAIDPPPPVEASGSSLLYSKEFYTIAKRRLRPDGLLQQWLPGGDSVELASVARALRESFLYIRVFRSVAGWGYHFIASERPIPKQPAAQLVHRMPAKAVTDMMEWGPQPNAVAEFTAVLDTELPIDELIAEAPDAPGLSDDRPVNEYYILRQRIVPKRWRHLIWREHWAREENEW